MRKGKLWLAALGFMVLLTACSKGEVNGTVSSVFQETAETLTETKEETIAELTIEAEDQTEDQTKDQTKDQTEDQTENQTGNQTVNGEIYGYIRNMEQKALCFDEIEWITFPSERAEKLGITEEEAPSGFYIYNEDDNEQELNVSDECKCVILDWAGNYETQDLTVEEFLGCLEERNGIEVPYILTVKDGVVVNIQEQYVP